MNNIPDRDQDPHRNGRGRGRGGRAGGRGTRTGRGDRRHSFDDRRHYSSDNRRDSYEHHRNGSNHYEDGRRRNGNRSEKEKGDEDEFARGRRGGPRADRRGYDNLPPRRVRDDDDYDDDDGDYHRRGRRSHSYGGDDYGRRGYRDSSSYRGGGRRDGNYDEDDRYGRRRDYDDYSGDGDQRYLDDRIMHRNRFGRRDFENPRWPPPFEVDGSAYTFDANSGFFYDPRSNFYYEPKSKLYYSNKESVYYSYDAQKNEFIKVVRATATADTTHSPDDKEGLKNNAHKIVIGEIKLKTATSVATSTKTDDNPVSSTLVPSKKKLPGDKHEQDMQKWAQRQRENDVKCTEGNDSNAVKVSENTYTTKDGAPVCIICKRKFASILKLREHESRSELHKHNVKNNKTQDMAKYMDRAKQRRFMHGGVSAMGSQKTKEEELTNLALAQGPSLTKARVVLESEVAQVKPGENLSSANIGHQLLQKLGWKEGKSLGKEREGKMANENNMSEDIKKDWELIESLAATNGQSNQRKRQRNF